MCTDAEREHTLLAASLPDEAISYQYNGDIGTVVVTNQKVTTAITREIDTTHQAALKAVAEGTLDDDAMLAVQKKGEAFVAEMKRLRGT
jgi:hypothetical protein